MATTYTPTFGDTTIIPELIRATKNELTCVILCAKVTTSNTHITRGAQANTVSTILNVPACFVKHKGAIFFMAANEAEKILRTTLEETTEPLHSAIKFTLTNWTKISDGVDEEWRDVIGFDGHYQVSNLGRVKSFKWNVEKILKPNCSKGGYPRVSLYQNGKLKKVLVHVLIAKAFLPNPNNLPVVNHIDNVRSNNRVENLEWVTYSENQKHAVRIGARKVPRGEEHPLAKLTQAQADDIRKLHVPADPEFGAKALAKKYEVTLRTIYRILHNKSYVKS